MFFLNTGIKSVPMSSFVELKTMFSFCHKKQGELYRVNAGKHKPARDDEFHYRSNRR